MEEFNYMLPAKYGTITKQVIWHIIKHALAKFNFTGGFILCIFYRALPLSFNICVSFPFLVQLYHLSANKKKGKKILIICLNEIIYHF